MENARETILEGGEELSTSGIVSYQHFNGFMEFKVVIQLKFSFLLNFIID